MSMFDRAKRFIGLEEEVYDEELATETRKEYIDLGPLRAKNNTKKSNDSELDISIYEPKNYDNSIEISAKLRQGCPVIVNLKFLDNSDGTRLIDFICGTAYDIDGRMHRIAETIFLLTPSHIAIADLSDKSSGDHTLSKEGLLRGRS